ncbi:AbiTii domain-containing protein [Paraburkholderia graminis]|uniref:AbiTii domain-containing protein n=1 Tax=Paraburkholderia graminis TaxID=60548 RepID=A0ABD5CQ41_9BURK|nr:hypothetical protein [Paraburkholderia graminis]MDR6206956.1 hypothetical protein [Paraburkholderia graminis]
MSFPLVIELQRMALSHDTSVIQLVRTAKLVAAKLSVPEAEGWIDRELNGYKGGEMIPPYRTIPGECRARNPFHGWIPVQFPDAELQALVSEGRIGQSLGSMERYLNDTSGHLMLQYTYERERELQKLFSTDMQFAIRIPSAQINGIFDAVRNLTLDWSLELELAGVLGDNMTFTLTEKQEAKPVTQQFIIQNAGVVGNVTDNATVTNNQAVHGSLSVERVRDLVQQAKSALPALPDQTAAQAGTLLDELDAESRKPSPNENKLRSALTSLRTVCEGAMGNLVASGITTAVTALLKHGT